MWLIITLIIVGLILIVAELVLLPGLSVAGICALLALAGASYLAFGQFGTTVGVITLIVIIVLAVAVTVVSLRANTWKRLSLKSTIDSASIPTPQEHNIRIGDCGVALTRLAPMGKVVINGTTIEAKTVDAFIDQKKEIEVIGFENFNVVVKKKG
ncbi:MAG: serine protease [Rikenellaceae bacterium]|nr:serine protease [Rikenellaceae bacterium]